MFYMKGIVVLLLALISLTSVSPALAQSEATSTTKARTVRLGTPVGTEKMPMEGLSAVKRVKVMNFSNNMIVRLEALVDRLQILIDRIDSRLVKIGDSDESVDTERINEVLDDAEAKLAAIKVKIADLKVNFGNLPESDDPKSQFVEVRQDINEVKMLLKELHSMLVGVVGDIKGLRVGNTKGQTPESSSMPAVKRPNEKQ